MTLLLSACALRRPWRFTLAAAPSAIEIGGEYTNAGYFRVLGLRPGVSMYIAIARLRPGVGRQQAEREFRVVYQRLLDEAARIVPLTGAASPATGRLAGFNLRHLLVVVQLSLSLALSDRPALYFAGLLALAAFVLAMSGLYGTLAHTVVRREREMGIRMALGASPAGILGQVLGQGLRMAAGGLAIGLLVANPLGRTVVPYLGNRGLLLSWACASGGVVVLGVSTLASYWPARRATRRELVHVLRAE